MSIRIQAAIDTMIAAVPGAPFAETVDTVKMGDASQPLTGIVLTFMATPSVLKQAAQLGANLIITHEPTFYNHFDNTNWLAQDATYQAKKNLIAQYGLVIWRFHDYLHSIPPDNTVMGLLQAFGWQSYLLPDQPFICNIPPMTFADLAAWVKERLGLSTVRVVGELTMPCRKIAILPGAPGGEMQIGVFVENGVDVLIAGEINEWEVSEYVRDSIQLGHPKGLIVTGHSASEEPGIYRMLAWLQEHLPQADVHYIASGPALSFL